MSTVIKVENLSKQYRLGDVGTGTIAHDLNRWWHRVRGNEDPYLTLGEVNDRTIKGVGEYVWALKDINFKVEQGDVLGIIGRNGAGKSTLLKILSRTTAPTTGTVKIRGRVASLLEVGTGFHPELSGRENVFLNGAILGMTRAEIKKKFDEIVDFSGVERYIDTPVKRYSSGMYVRLAFGVAAHLESEILIVDEVLAVGDAEFQKKCLGKMKDVSTKEGRTVLFVSHNLGAIKGLCDRSLLLEKGNTQIIGQTNDVINYYFKDNFKNVLYTFNLIHLPRTRNLGTTAKIEKIVFNDNTPIIFGYPLKISFYLKILKSIEDVCIGIGFNTNEEVRILTIDSDTDLVNNIEINLSSGIQIISMVVEDFRLAPGIYTFDIGLRRGKGTESLLDFVKMQEYLQIEPGDRTANHFLEGNTGGYRPIPTIIA